MVHQLRVVVQKQCADANEPPSGNAQQLDDVTTALRKQLTTTERQTA
jgi:hypothetical protein